MVRIRRFGVVGTANSIAAIYAVVFGIIFLVVGLILAVAGPTAGTGRGGGATAVGVLITLVVVWLIYTVLVWIAVALSCLLYNGIAGRVGGIQMQIETLQRPGGYGPGLGYGQPQQGAVPPGQAPAPWDQGQPAPGRWEPPGR